MTENVIDSLHGCQPFKVLTRPAPIALATLK